MVVTRLSWFQSVRTLKAQQGEGVGSLGPSGAGKPLEGSDVVRGSLGYGVQGRWEQGGSIVRKII